jgi:hypothetical protein
MTTTMLLPEIAYRIAAKMTTGKRTRIKRSMRERTRMERRKEMTERALQQTNRK